MTRRRAGFLAVLLPLFLLCGTPTARPIDDRLPGRLDDRTFWTLIQESSEPNGFFRSDNLVSNETEFQTVIPSLLAHQQPASAYVGVGPEQNFTYIAALHPRIAFIVDIRRQNLLLHLFYKTLMELSPTRTDFLSRLFARALVRAPDDVPIEDLMRAYAQEPADEQLYAQTLADMHAQVARHGFALSADDWAGLEFVDQAFYGSGPELRYSFGRGYGWYPFPSFGDLMMSTDAAGLHRSFLATDASYAAVRDLEVRNLIVPIVGDFAGPKALRSVGRWLRQRGGTVTVFYTSNVEQYLFRGDDWQRFYANVASLPVGARGVFVRSLFMNVVRTPGVYPAPYPLRTPGAPRSVSVINSIEGLLTAVADGRVQSYRDLATLARQP